MMHLAWSNFEALLDARLIWVCSLRRKAWHRVCLLLANFHRHRHGCGTPCETVGAPRAEAGHQAYLYLVAPLQHTLCTRPAYARTRSYKSGMLLALYFPHIYSCTNHHLYYKRWNRLKSYDLLHESICRNYKGVICFAACLKNKYCCVVVFLAILAKGRASGTHTRTH